MHECPFCGEECDCDMDDTGGLPVPDDCPHVCADPGDDDEYDDDRTCPACGGSGETGKYYDHCGEGVETCKTCGGTGAVEIGDNNGGSYLDPCPDCEVSHDHS